MVLAVATAAAACAGGGGGNRKWNFLGNGSRTRSESYWRGCRVLLLLTSGFTVCLVVFTLSTVATTALSAVIRVRRFGALRSLLRGSTFRSPTATAAGTATFAGTGDGCCCLMVEWITMMLLLLMMPLRHCREHLLTNGFGHRRHFDVPLCPLNSIPVVEFRRRWWAAAAPGHNTLIHKHCPLPMSHY